MTRQDAEALAPGLYLLHWKEEGSSLAAVGIERDGRRWFAPTNWTLVPSFDWSMVERVELLRDAVEDAPPEDVMVKEIQYPAPGGGMTLKLSHGVVPFIAGEFVKFFKKSGGVNYVEFTMVDGKNPEMGPFTVTIQRALGKTPGMVVAELKAKVSELEAKGKQ